jgi:hypothetical protein
MSFQKYNIYKFFQQKVLASLYISKEIDPKLLEIPTFLNITITFNSLKVYDINLLTINALLYLMFGQYPACIFNKKLAKYRKSKISFKLSFSKKEALYCFSKLFLFCLSRQPDFVGYFLKTNFFLLPVSFQNYTFPVKTLHIFYILEYLYSQQPKNLLIVKQPFTLNVNCSFQNYQNFNLNYLTASNIPFIFEQFSNINEQQKD